MPAGAVQLIDGPTGEGVVRLDLARLRPGQGYQLPAPRRSDRSAAEGRADAGVHLAPAVSGLKRSIFPARGPRSSPLQGGDRLEAVF